MPDGMTIRHDPAAAIEGREQWITAAQSKADPFVFVASTDDVDRMGDVIEVGGWKLTNFKKNPIALWAHDSRNPIGTWEDVEVRDGALMARLAIAEANTSPWINTVRSLLAQRILRACSVGFRALKVTPLEGSKIGGLHFLEQELLEISIVTVPANPAAVSIARSFNLPDDQMARLFAASGSIGPPPAQDPPALPPSAKPAITTRSATTGTPKMKISERIATMESDLLSKRDALTALANKEALDDADNALLGALPDEIKSIEASIQNWKKAQATLGAAAQPAGGADTTTTTTTTRTTQPGVGHNSGLIVPGQVKKGRAADLLIQSALIALRSYVERRSPDEILERDFGDNKELITVTRAVVQPAQTGVTGWAAELMDTVTGDFQDLLMPESIWRRMPMMRFTFDNGKIRLPGRSARGLAGDFVSENQPIPVKRTTFVSVNLEPYKLAVITSLTRELARYSNPSAIPILRQAMTDDTMVTLDTLFLDATAAVATKRPAGLQALATGANTRASSGTTLANVITDLKAATTQMGSLNMGRRPVWIMNTVRFQSLALMVNAAGTFMFRDELMNGTLIGIPVLHSTNVPSAIVFLVDAAELATASDITPEIEISTDATLHMQSTPTSAVADGTGAVAGEVQPIAFPAGGAPGGTPGTADLDDYAQPVQSMFQTNALALRLIWPIDWDLRRAGGVQTITGVAW